MRRTEASAITGTTPLSVATRRRARSRLPPRAAPGVLALHHERQLAPARQGEAGLHPLALAPGELQLREHLVERQSERLERALPRLDPDLLQAGPGRHPGLGDLRHRLELGPDVARQPLELLAVGSGEHHLGRRTSEQPAEILLSRRTATAAPAELIFPGAQDLDALHLPRRAPHRLAHPPGPESGGAVRGVDELGGERPALLPDRRLDGLDPLELQHRALQPAHRFAGRVERALSGGEADRELDDVRLGRFLGRRLHGDPGQRDERGHQHRRGGTGDPGRGMAQRAGDDAAEEHPSRIRRDQTPACGPPPPGRQDAAPGGRSRQPVREERHQPHRHHERRPERHQDREGDHLEQLPHEGVVDVDEGQRQEHDRGGGAGGDDRADGPPQALPHRDRRLGAPLESPLHRLVDDHAVVHQQADREREPEQGDQVERLAGQVQERQRRQQAHRHGHRHHRHRAPLAQEEEEHHQRDREAGGPQPGQPGELVFDRLSGVEADRQVEPHRPELLPHLGHALAQAPAQPDQVGALFLKDGQVHRGPPVDPRQHFLAARADPQVAHVAQQRAPVRRDAGVAQRGQPARPAVEDDRRAPGLALQVPEEPQVADVGPEESGDGVGGHVERGGAIGVYGHRHLAPGAAARQRLADAGHRGEPGRHVLLHQVVERVSIFRVAPQDVDRHREARQHRQVERRRADVGAARLRALQGGGDASQLELAHREIGPGLELHLEAPGRAPDLAPGLGDPRQPGDPRLQR